ncbi:MAG: tandem-95 repeat protein [Planctomycetaceae bacterium]|nr:tandem-95 repeat protein [Planctomycetaceae bacterium]
MSIDQLEARCLLAGIPEMILLDTEGDSFPTDFVQVGEVVFFTAQDEERGRELWVTDGTAAGSNIVRDIFPGFENSNPADLTELDGKLYFTADNGANGRELWASDGTESGTLMLKDIQTGFDYDNQPYSSSPTHLISFDEKLYFAADDGVNGNELWMSDGTSEGTMMLKDIAPGQYENYYYGSYPYASSPNGFVEVDGTLFFAADNARDGVELWKSDGSADGTVLVRDIHSGEGYQYPYGDGALRSLPSQLTNVDGTLFFTAVDENGEELWMSDGTEAGTVMIEDLFTGSFTDEYGTYPYSSYPRNLTDVNGTLFFTGVNPNTGEELFRYNRALETVEVVRDIVPGAESGLFQPELTSSNGTLIFTADNGNDGVEIWKSDGSEAGTIQIRDLNSGSVGSDPRYLTDIDGKVYFSAASTEQGRELYATDGTLNGTIQIADLFVGDQDSSPNSFFGYQDLVLFNADDGGTGFQLWTLSEQTTQSASLTIFVDGQQLEIPANIGVAADGSLLSQTRTDANGDLIISPIADEPLVSNTLNAFFETWRTMAGEVGNNPDATFESDNLLGNMTDADHSIRMFVNGEISNRYEDYDIQHGDEILLTFGQNTVVALQTNLGDLYLELFDKESSAPVMGTVTNFLSYANDGSYENSIIHRSVPNFVIQGGGFTSQSPQFTSTDQFENIPSKGQIQNEPGISNQRATIAMAKLGGDPNSATSQFFINLDDNTFLDLPENNSFTAFGQVLDMTVADTIANLPINSDNSPPFDELPLTASDQLAIIEGVDGIGLVSGTKYEDLNTNGVKDPSEPGLEGFTIYLDANNDGVWNDGEDFTTTDSNGDYRLQAATGTYAVRSMVTSNRIQTFPSLLDGHLIDLKIGQQLTQLNFGEADLPSPSTISLSPASDTGSFDNDNITRLDNGSPENSLQFQVVGVANEAEVRIYASGILVGSGAAVGDQAVVTTDGMTTFPNGTQSFTATQVFNGLESDMSSPVAITVDSLPPQDIDSAPPEFANVDEAFMFDVSSPDENQTGMTYSLVDGPSGMTITNEGMINWTPTGDQARPHDFEIQLSDTAGNRTSQRVELTVLGVLPALPDSYLTAEDTPLTVNAENGLFANDGDGSGTSEWNAQLVDQAIHGTVTLNADGSFEYVPNPDVFGTDQFTYSATNGESQANIARVQIEVTDQNDPPNSEADNYQLNEDETLTRTASEGVLVNDMDPDGDSINVTLSSDVSHGTLSLNSDGSFTYQPDQNYFGIDTFTYTASDGISESPPTVVTLTTNPIEDSPITAPDSYLVAEDNSIQIDAANGVLSNDADADNDQLSATIEIQASHGTVTLEPDGAFTYTPDANFFGSDSFSYRASDGISEVSETVSVQVTSIADPPTANDDSFTAGNDGNAVTIDVLANDSYEPDGVQTLNIASVTPATQGGQVTIVNNAIEYLAPLGFAGTDTFSYTLEDSDGLTSVAAVTIEVGDSSGSQLTGSVYIDINDDGLRDTLEAGVPGVLITLVGETLSGEQVDHSAITNESGNYQFSELPAGTYQITESQPAALSDGQDRFDFEGALVADDQITNIVISGAQDIEGPSFGETSIKSEHLSIQWFFASADEASLFREVVADAEEQAGNQTLADAIRDASSELPAGSNRAPIGLADQYETALNETLSVSLADGLLSNDVDPDGDSLTANLVRESENGALNLNPDGSFTYTPNLDFTGNDSFLYSVTDETDDSPPVVVSIDVQEQVNEFNIDENSPAGSTVGTVEAEGELSETVIFEFEDSARPEELNLVTDDHLAGGENAPMVLIEYADFQCTACRTYHSIVKDLKNQFGDELLVVTRHLPLSGTHQNAVEAAVAAEAAAKQGSFDEMSDLLYENQNEWASLVDPISLFEGYAVALGLDLTQFNADLIDPALTDRVNRDRDAALELGATGTPTFYLNGEALEDVPSDFNDFEVLIQEELDDFDETFLLGRITGELSLTGSNPPNFESRPQRDLQIRATDDAGTVQVLDVTVNVNDLNESPLAFADSYDANPDQLLAIELGEGILANDLDVDTDTLTASLNSDVSNGVLTLQEDGAFFYTPNPNFLGSDSFSYFANDGELNSNEATVTINVNALGEGEPEEADLLPPLSNNDLVDLAFEDEASWLV